MDNMYQVIYTFAPAIIVFITAWYLLKTFFDNERRQRAIEWKKKDILSLKVQAYERLTLLCERCDLMPLILRMQTPEMTAEQLHASLFIGITQEFDHNVTQQIYISEPLWQLISAARQETMELLATARQTIEPKASREQYIDAVFQVLKQIGGSSPFQKALQGIRAEATLIMQ
jgi:hypothetical protein